jgi:imidazoleglycerol-phosphate dehydratase
MREAEIKRKTKETDISLKLQLSDLTNSSVNSGIAFFDHMLMSMAKHGRFCLQLECKGDIEIDAHHSVEDIGICLGKAFKEALGEKIGIVRFGEAIVPMDEALTLVGVDISGRYHLGLSGVEFNGCINNYPEELTEEFFKAFAVNAGINLHIKVLSGENKHHIHESIFKSVGIALYRASIVDPMLNEMVMSTKGVID